MISRRKFVQDSILASTGLTILGSSITGYAYKLQDFKSNRPLPENRTFSSEAVEEIIIKVKQGIRNPELSWLFENCFPNTLDTTVDFEIKDGKPDAFIITGDIDAMWLRDSTAQIWP